MFTLFSIVVATVLVAGVAASLTGLVRAVRTGARASGDLAVDIALQRPRRAADWPDTRLDAVVPDPEHAERVLVVARWPARPESRALLVLEVDDPTIHTHRLLMSWRDLDAPLVARLDAGDRLMLCRRRTPDVVRARILEETALPRA